MPSVATGVVGICRLCNPNHPLSLYRTMPSIYPQLNGFTAFNINQDDPWCIVYLLVTNMRRPPTHINLKESCEEEGKTFRGRLNTLAQVLLYCFVNEPLPSSILFSSIINHSETTESTPKFYYQTRDEKFIIK